MERKHLFHFQNFQILSGRRSKQRQSEFNLAVTLVSIVFMHIVCNALRVFLGVLVVALVGKYERKKLPVRVQSIIPAFEDVQVECIKHADRYIPPLWIMCLESVAHLLVMLNFSSNFLIYCSVSNQFKMSLSKVCGLLCTSRVGHDVTATSEYYSVAVDTGIRLLGFK